MDVLVKVHAVSLNLIDAKVRDGEFKPVLPYKPPFIAGHDVAGTVVRVGAGVRKFKVGDAVYARPRDGSMGTFAQYIAIDEADLALKPKNLSFEEAASIPLVGLTAWQALVDRANLKPGQKVFIQAGSGGVGTFAIQLARHLGATVATTTSAANAQMVRDLGAELVVDYKSEDFEKLLFGYDVVLNSQDTATLEKSLHVLKKAASPCRSRAHPTRRLRGRKTSIPSSASSWVCSAAAFVPKPERRASATRSCSCRATALNWPSSPRCSKPAPSAR